MLTFAWTLFETGIANSWQDCRNFAWFLHQPTFADVSIERKVTSVKEMDWPSSRLRTRSNESRPRTRITATASSLVSRVRSSRHQSVALHRVSANRPRSASLLLRSMKCTNNRSKNGKEEITWNCGQIDCVRSSRVSTCPRITYNRDESKDVDSAKCRRIDAAHLTSNAPSLSIVAVRMTCTNPETPK